jgi:hypothetical protein
MVRTWWAQFWRLRERRRVLFRCERAGVVRRCVDIWVRRGGGIVDFDLEILEGRTILVVEGILVVGGGGVGVVEAGILAD